MEEDDLSPRKAPKTLRDLSNLSIEELEDYVSELQAEIARVQDDIAKKKRHRAGVEGLFKRGSST